MASKIVITGEYFMDAHGIIFIFPFTDNPSNTLPTVKADYDFVEQRPTRYRHIWTNRILVGGTTYYYDLSRNKFKMKHYRTLKSMFPASNGGDEWDGTDTANAARRWFWGIGLQKDNDFGNATFQAVVTYYVKWYNRDVLPDSK